VACLAPLNAPNYSIHVPSPSSVFATPTVGFQPISAVHTPHVEHAQPAKYKPFYEDTPPDQDKPFYSGNGGGGGPVTRVASGWGAAGYTSVPILTDPGIANYGFGNYGPGFAYPVACLAPLNPPKCSHYDRRMGDKQTQEEIEHLRYQPLKAIAALLADMELPPSRTPPGPLVQTLNTSVGPTEDQAPAMRTAPEGMDKVLEIFCGTHPYDHLRQLKLEQSPEQTLCLTHGDLHKLWRAEVYASGDAAAIRAWLQGQGLERAGILLARVFTDEALAATTALSIECCASVTYLPPSQLQTLRQFTDALLKRGANVALADFALDIADALFAGRLPRLFKAIRTDVSGAVKLRFDGGALADAPNGQISMLGNLAEGGEVTINTLANTRRPVLRRDAQPAVRVLAVAAGAGEPQVGDLVDIDPKTGKWKPLNRIMDEPPPPSVFLGSPAIIIVDDEYGRQNGWKGSVVLFAAHFSEISKIGGLNEESVIDLYAQCKGEAEAARFKNEYYQSSDARKSEMLQTSAYGCIQSAPQSRKMYSSASRKVSKEHSMS